MSKKKLIFATNNRHKLEEVKAMLGEKYELLSLNDIGCEADIPETANTFAGNALLKARFVKEHFGYDCFADDSGLEVDALHGEPGIYSARYGSIAEEEIDFTPSVSHDSEANMNKLLFKLRKLESNSKKEIDRSAQFRTVTALIEGEEEHLFEGLIRGKIISTKRGNHGFGYDPIFVPEGYTQTFAELPEEVKNTISHRARSIEKFCTFLASRLSLVIILFILFCGYQLPLKAQVAMGEWRTHLAYNEVTYSEPANDRLYVLASGALFSYDMNDESITTYNKVKQLNDQDISFIIYNKNQNLLFILYSNYNIDLLTSDGTAYNIPDYMNKTLSQDKTVNSLSTVGDKVLMNTNFGIVEIDVKNKLINNTYILDKPVNSSILYNGTFLAATTSGLFRGNSTDNLLDVNNWQQINTTQYKCVSLFDSHLFVTKADEGLFLFNTNDNVLTLVKNGNFNLTHNCDKYLIVSDGWDSFSFSTYNSSVTFTPAVWFKNISYLNNHYWTINAKNELLQTTLNTTTNQITVDNTVVTPEGPIRNLADYMRVDHNRVFVCGGGISADRYNNPGTIMVFEDEKWTSFQEEGIPDSTGLDFYRDITTVAIDPNDPTHVFASSAGEGLYEFRNAKYVNLYSINNSTLKTALSAYPNYFVRVNGLNYDSDGNLWMTNVSTNTLNILKKDGTFTSLYYSDIAKTPTPTRTLIDSSGRIWVVCSRSTNGVFCVDTNGTLEDTSDDKTKFRSSYTNQDGTAISGSSEALRTYAIAEDMDGQIWIGTAMGPLLVSNPSKWFNDSFTVTQVKIPRNDGTGLADYLLSGQRINDIAIDGGNRKWFATQNNGVYLMSADGTEEIHHFTTNNSPLLSDQVKSIAILPQTGEVFFGTAKGIISYQSDATKAEPEFSSDVHAFPNPVQPNYTGPITISGLVYNSDVKIVDAAGKLVNKGTSIGGTFTWNGYNIQGKRVASGVYMVFAADSEGKSGVVTKIVIIR